MRYGSPSARAAAKASSAASAPSTSVCRQPQASSMPATTLRLVALSSTARMRTPVTSIGSRRSSPLPRTVASCLANCAVNQKVEPTPGSLATPISPPMSCTRRRQMDRPRPVPPNRRVVEASACVNASNNTSSLSAAMPMPVSRTSKRTVASASPSSTRLTDTATSPLSVNLMALPTRLVRTCRSRPGSPRSADGTSASTSAVSSSPLPCACSAGRSQVSSTVRRRSKSRVSSSSFPASILEKSRMSLMIVSSASALFCTVWA